MEVVNARSVAKALNCSTQPIFRLFSGMEDLRSTVIAQVAQGEAYLACTVLVHQLDHLDVLGDTVIIA